MLLSNPSKDLLQLFPDNVKRRDLVVIIGDIEDRVLLIHDDSMASLLSERS